MDAGKQKSRMAPLSTLYCPVCSVKKDGDDNMSAHIAQEHLKWLPYTCLSCDERRSSVEQMEEHALAAHSIKDPQMLFSANSATHAQLKKLMQLAKQKQFESFSEINGTMYDAMSENDTVTAVREIMSLAEKREETAMGEFGLRNSAIKQEKCVENATNSPPKLVAPIPRHPLAVKPLTMPTHHPDMIASPQLQELLSLRPSSVTPSFPLPMPSTSNISVAETTTIDPNSSGAMAAFLSLQQLFNQTANKALERRVKQEELTLNTTDDSMEEDASQQLDLSLADTYDISPDTHSLNSTASSNSPSNVFIGKDGEILEVNSPAWKKKKYLTQGLNCRKCNKPFNNLLRTRHIAYHIYKAMNICRFVCSYPGCTHGHYRRDYVFKHIQTSHQSQEQYEPIDSFDDEMKQKFNELYEECFGHATRMYNYKMPKQSNSRVTKVTSQNQAVVKKERNQSAISKRKQSIDGRKKKRCYICRKSFQTTSEEILNHAAVHMAELHSLFRYRCRVCDYACTTLQTMQQHNEEIHEQEDIEIDDNICAWDLDTTRSVSLKAYKNADLLLSVMPSKWLLANLNALQHEEDEAENGVSNVEEMITLDGDESMEVKEYETDDIHHESPPETTYEEV